MNFFSHALPFLDSPMFMAGTCLPDWLSVLDRRTRARPRRVEPWTESENKATAQLARGIMRHFHDDAWFHETSAFAQLNLDFSVQLRELCGIDDSLRTRLVGHILIEMLLDDWLRRRFPGRLEQFYYVLENISVEQLSAGVAQITGNGELDWSDFLPRFNRARFIFDYSSNQGIVFRLNQILKRVALPLLPEFGAESALDSKLNRLSDWLNAARKSVDELALELLHQYALPLEDPHEIRNEFAVVDR